MDWEPVPRPRIPFAPVNFDLAITFGVLFGVFFGLSVILVVVVCVVSRKWRDIFGGGSLSQSRGNPQTDYGS